MHMRTHICINAITRLHMLSLIVTLRKVYDRNVVNKHRICFLLGVISFCLIDYIYISMHVCDTQRNTVCSVGTTTSNVCVHIHAYVHTHIYSTLTLTGYNASIQHMMDGDWLVLFCGYFPLVMLGH